MCVHVIVIKKTVNNIPRFSEKKIEPAFKRIFQLENAVLIE